MLRFISRRLLIALGVFFVSTFFFFLLAANAGDPLEDLRASTQKNRDELIAARTKELNLDVAPPIRYFYWLAAAVRGDLGRDYRSGQPVEEMISYSAGETLKLIGFAAVAAIVIGATIGIISAIRQYSGFDYGVTLVNFFLYSLPSFWVAVLLKQWGAIGFNDFLQDPKIPPLALILIGATIAIVVGSAVGGQWRHRLTVGGISGAVTIALLWYFSVSGWFLDPRLGPVAVLILAVAVALAAVFLVTGLKNRKALWLGLTLAALALVLYFPMQEAFKFTDGIVTLASFAGFALGGAVLGWFWNLPDRKTGIRIGAIVAVGVYGLLWLDFAMSFWKPYSNSAAINGRPIATVGASTPQLTGSGFWIGTVDTYTHMVLPVVALILVSLAGYTRYARASMLEVMNLDYIRTARAKGLPERIVIVRHAFRNALIPLATIIPLDLAALVGGAVITETVFGWNGMGRLFVDALNSVNTNVLMGYFLVTGVLLIIGNLIADLLYAVLDPRIRVE